MSGTATLALFATMLLISAVPGPVDFAVIARSIQRGFAGAMILVSGILLGEVLLVLTAAVGLAMVVERFPAAFNLIVWVGGLVLIALGISIWRTEQSPNRTAARAADQKSKVSKLGSGASSVLTGMTITLADPKAIAFYAALLPGFVDLSTADRSDILTIMATALTAVFLVKTGYAWGADRAMAMLERRGVRMWIQRGAALALIATGCVLPGRQLLQMFA